MTVYRLTEDLNGLPEGSCISEMNYKNLYFGHRCLFEPIQDFERKDMIEHTDEQFCMENGLMCLLFYTSKELDNFVMKKFENGIVD